MAAMRVSPCGQGPGGVDKIPPGRPSWSKATVLEGGEVVEARPERSEPQAGTRLLTR